MEAGEWDLWPRRLEYRNTAKCEFFLKADRDIHCFAGFVCVSSHSAVFSRPVAPFSCRGCFLAQGKKLALYSPSFFAFPVFFTVSPLLSAVCFQCQPKEKSLNPSPETADSLYFVFFFFLFHVSKQTDMGGVGSTKELSGMVAEGWTEDCKQTLRCVCACACPERSM